MIHQGTYGTIINIWYNTGNNERRQMATVDVSGIRIIPDRLGLNDNLTKMLEKAPDDRYKFKCSIIQNNIHRIMGMIYGGLDEGICSRRATGLQLCIYLTHS
jgi:hypothetical protein